MPRKTKNTKSTVVTIDAAFILEDNQGKFDLLLETYEATRGPTKAEFDQKMDGVTERLVRVEIACSLMSKDLSGVKSDVAVLKSDVSVLKAGQTRMEAQLTGVAKVVKQHDSKITNLRSVVGSSPRGHRP